MKTKYSAFLIGCILAIISGCTPKTSDDASANKPGAVVLVEVAPIRVGDINVTIDAVGRTEALRKETILSPAAGTIVSLKALEGTVIQSGDTLVVIVTKESQAALIGAQTLLAVATTPEQKKEAERAFELAKSSQNLMPIVSKLSGIVSARNVVEGSLVAEGGELLTIVDPASIVFVAQVPLKSLALVALGEPAKVTFTSAGDRQYKAVVSAISPGSDPETQTVRARLNFGNVSSEQRVFMKDGITGTAQIVTGARTKVFLVPTPALLRNDENDTYSIVTVTDDSLSRSVSVIVGVINDSIAEVSGDGLQPGMSVVITGNYALADSTRLNITTGSVK